MTMNLMKQEMAASIKATLVVMFFCVLGSTSFAQEAPVQQTPARYPKFSWDKVPVAFHFGKSSSLMTEAEARFVASRSNFICLEKGHAAGQFGDTETGIEKEAQQLQKLNPDMKVIFYDYSWGYRMEHGCLEWYPGFDRPLGEPLGDMVREGWTLKRQFKHASVWVNLESREADIQWR